MKKRLLFVNESLTLAGGEKSLIALLSNIDPEKYAIDLQLFHYGGELDQFIPAYVNVLPPIPYTTFVAQSFVQNLFTVFRRGHLRFLWSRLKYSLALRKGVFNHPEKAQIYWESVKSCIANSNESYDVAIAYAQGVPTFYVMDRILAKKKIAWVNVNVKFSERNKIYQEQYYIKYDSIVAVSEVTNNHLQQLFPSLTKNIVTIADIIDYPNVLKMSKLSAPGFQLGVYNILTVARLNRDQKGYDISLEACRILKDKGYMFNWYAIGEGPYKDEMIAYIKENELGEYFTLLGTTSNPYPYFLAADLYVQSSRHEGYGLSIAEARLLNKPVVTTRFDTVFMQMVHEKNGLVVDIDAEAVADGIIRMMEDKELYDNIVYNLQKEPKVNLESIQQFYELIDN